MVPDHADQAGELIVTSLELRTFRSYAGLDLELRPGRTLVVGPNGAGKTNLLEGLHVATQSFSPRTRSDRRVVMFGEQAARAAATGHEQTAAFTSQVTVPASGAKQAVLNGVPTTGEELRRRLPVLVFVPDRLAVVKGGPAVRRTYFDRMLARVRPSAGAVPSDYASALSQRNAALRRVAAELASPTSIDPWDHAVAELGTELDELRAGLVSSLADRFEQRCESIGLAAATLSYDAERLTADALREARARDLRRGSTTVGPHLRDVAVRAGGLDLRSYGSQGQQRLAVLGLLLAEADLLASDRGIAPVLLLDDVLSELDGDRRRSLLQALAPDSQTLLTSAALDGALEREAEPATVVRVESGSAAEVSAA